MEILNFIMVFLLFCVYLFILNFIRYIKASIYQFKYKFNCETNNYLSNVKFYRSVARLFKKANTEMIDLRNHMPISECLNDSDYEEEINLCFAKTIATFRDRFFRPWYIFAPSAHYNSKLASALLTVLKLVLIPFLCQVGASLLEMLGIFDTLAEILALKFPFVGELLKRLDLLLDQLRTP